MQAFPVAAQPATIPSSPEHDAWARRPWIVPALVAYRQESNSRASTLVPARKGGLEETTRTIFECFSEMAWAETLATLYLEVVQTESLCFL